MKEVLYLGPDYKNHRGGIGALLEVYARHIPDFNFIATYSGGSPLRIIVLYIYAWLRLVNKLLWSRHIKILHIHTASRGSFLRKSALVLTGKLFGRKVILHIHGGGFHNFYARARFLRPYIRFVLKKTDLVICLSEKWRQYYMAEFGMKRLEVVNNVIEHPLDPPSVSPASNGRVNLLFLGLICDSKGVFDLLDVVARSRTLVDGRITVTIAGNGETERLQQLIRERHPDGEVEFAGWVNGVQKAALLHSCDIYVLPSYNEGLPISILEAISYGKPIIATPVGGVPEIVRPGFNGWLVEPGNGSALQSVLQEVADENNRAMLKEYGLNSLSLAKTYTPESVFSSLDRLYQHLIRGK